MADKLQKTIQTYDNHAQEFADYFRKIKTSRVEDINATFNLLDDTLNPSVIEVGCADGRDAEEILKRTVNYIGFDSSKKLIELAKKNLPEGNFLVEDMRTYKFPPSLDIVFAFASFIHLNKKELKAIIMDIHRSLNNGGVLFLSLKRGDSYRSYIKRDGMGERLYYLYNPENIKKITHDYFKEVLRTTGFTTNENTEWFEMILKKI